jgi:solute carrier family 8 (sodium/calcium exchanger)
MEKGIVLPLFGEAEQNWPQGLRAVLYLIGLLWMFLGVAIVADIFMAAIEKVTSAKRRVFNKAKGEWYTYTVWNGTIANLSLMALGSSAPEILLNVVEIVGGGFVAGKLGPSTVVGSAAFNLFVISAVCVMSIEGGEVRVINDLQVFTVTAISSVFAYLWLLFIVQGPQSPDGIEVWEGVLTFLWFPVLLVVAFLADKGYLSKGGSEAKQQLKKINLLEAATKDFSALDREIRQKYGENLTPDEVAQIMDSQYGGQNSRAAYRIGAIRSIVGGKRVHLRSEQKKNDIAVKPAPEEKEEDKTYIEFLSDHYTVGEAGGQIELAVRRRGGPERGTVKVQYKTVEGDAKSGTDFEATTGELVFPSNFAGETKIIAVKIVNDRETEKDECFYVELESPKCDDPKVACALGPASRSTVKIVDDDLPGELKFEVSSIVEKENPKDWTILLKVLRVNGTSGQVSCKYRTEDDTALKGVDYEETSGELIFADGQSNATIEINIKSNGRYDDSDLFRVILEEAEGGVKFVADTDGGESQGICMIKITPDQAAKDRVDHAMKLMKSKMNKAEVGHANYKAQFIDAIMVNGGGGEEGEEVDKPNAKDWIMHIITLPWKFLFAFIPPTDYAGGWLCFVVALIMIGAVTVVIGDLAGLLGCVIGIPDGITAVTLVALGTSLPDTFASRTAAIQDEYADNSIGNVTGSNSVNVFLGIGLPWMMAAIYWNGKGGWAIDRLSLYHGEQIVADYPDGDIFVVLGGSLGFSVAVFSVLAICCLLLFVARRFTPSIGGELGGPAGPKYATAGVMVGMWVVFLIAYIAVVMGELTDCDKAAP